MRALFSTLGLSLAAVLAIVLVVTLVAPSRSVTAAADREAADPATSHGGGAIAEKVRAAGTGKVVYRYDTQAGTPKSEGQPFSGWLSMTTPRSSTSSRSC